MHVAIVACNCHMGFHHFLHIYTNNIIIDCSLGLLQSCFFSFWHYHPYILQHFNEMFLHLFHQFFLLLYNYTVATRILSHSELKIKHNIQLFDHKEILLSVQISTN